MNDRYRAKVTWDGDQWLADVVDLPGAHTYAKTVPSLRKRLREVVVLMDDRPDSDLNDPTAFDVSLDYSLVATEVVQARQARDEYEQLAAKLAQQAADRTREAILWARDQGISLRDTAELLDLSHQRINQIEKEIPTVRAGTLEKVVRTKGKDGVVRSRRGRGNGTTQTIDSVRTQRTE